jgi:hypothetical protein
VDNISHIAQNESVTPFITFPGFSQNFLNLLMGTGTEASPAIRAPSREASPCFHHFFFTVS